MLPNFIWRLGISGNYHDINYIKTNNINRILKQNIYRGWNQGKLMQNECKIMVDSSNNSISSAETQNELNLIRNLKTRKVFFRPYSQKKGQETVWRSSYRVALRTRITQVQVLPLINVMCPWTSHFSVLLESCSGNLSKNINCKENAHLH